MDPTHAHNNTQVVIHSQYESDPAIAKILHVFLDSLPGMLSDLRYALQGGDAATMASLAHQLKGAGGGYGYPTVSDVSAQLEQMAKDEDWELIATTLVRLESICAAVLRGRTVAPEGTS